MDILVKPRPELIQILLKDGNTHQGYIYDTLCWGRYRSDGYGVIQHLMVAIPSHLDPGDVETCLWIEITQGLGLPNDLKGLEPSIYSDAHFLTVGNLPWYDEIMVRTLYDHRLKPGMRRDRATPFVRIIIGELLTKRSRANGKVSMIQ